jgi:MOSC domain-containing protein YiiM
MLPDRGLESIPGIVGAVPGEERQVGKLPAPDARGAEIVSLNQVAQPRIPCFKLGLRLGDPQFPRRFAAAGRPGAYLRILVPGEVSPGDPITVSHRPSHGLTVAHVARVYHTDHDLAADLLRAPELADAWRAWAVKRTEVGSRG